jgi:hypothetical protein
MTRGLAQAHCRDAVQYFDGGQHQHDSGLAYSAHSVFWADYQVLVVVEVVPGHVAVVG